ncbi:MAG: S24 family peptidase [Henriciella sp.]
MLHSDIWRGLDLLAEKHGLTASALAKLAGLDATAFNKSKRRAKDGRLRWPSTESISRALNAVGVEFLDFAELVSDSQGRAIPLLRSDEASRVDMFSASGIPIANRWETVRFPGIQGREALYAIEITSRDLAPIYRSGDRIVLSPSAEIRAGDRVLVMTRNESMFPADLVRRSESLIEVTPLIDGSGTVKIRQEQLAWIARILWVSQ